MKRLLSWLLVLVMVFGLLPMSAFAAEVGVDTDFETEPDIIVDLWELQVGGSLANPMDLTVDLLNEGDFTAVVTVPAGKTMYLTANRVAGMEMTINDGEAVICGGNPMSPHAWSITNDGTESAQYTIKVAFPAGHQMNPVVIESMSWYSGEVSQAAGDNDGFFYKYIAEDNGTITLYFDAVYDDEGNAVDLGTQRNITVTNNNTYAQYDLLANGVDNYGLELIVPVSKGDEIIINTAWVKDADGNYYPEATYSWTGNFAYPAGSEKNPIAIEWSWDEDYANATASVTVEADGTYYTGNAAMILTANGEAVEQNAEGVFVLNAGTYELALATPVGAQANPEVIENIDGYTSEKHLDVDGAYYYIWTATEDGTVTLDVTDGANIVVDQIVEISEDGWPVSVQHELAEPTVDENWNYTGWNVAENLAIEVVAGQQLKIQVNALTDWSTWTTPAIDYTLSGSFEPAEPVIPEDAKLKFDLKGISFQDYIGLQFAIKLSNIKKYGYDRVYVETSQVTPNGVVDETINGIEFAGYYQLFDKKIVSWSMTEEVTLTLYGEKAGVLYKGESITTSVMAMALDKIAEYENKNDMEYCRVFVDMLNYGAAVQVSNNYNASSLPNASLEEYGYAKYATEETPDMVNNNSKTGSGIKVYTENFSMQDKVEIQLLMKSIDPSLYEIRATIDGVAINGAFFDMETFAGYTLVRVPVAAANMRKMISLAVYDIATGEPATAVYNVSVEGYAFTKLGTATESTAIAVMKYGDSVSVIAAR